MIIPTPPLSKSRDWRSKLQNLRREIERNPVGLRRRARNRHLNTSNGGLFSNIPGLCRFFRQPYTPKPSSEIILNHLFLQSCGKFPCESCEFEIK
ncbi:hypothetical protein Pfo_007514 [Paulownia fortunei]|nr:hypothetical protein Pfo_007514 [Paulownia fortunei]